MSAGRTARLVSRRLGRGEGAVIGGRVALAVDRGALTRLAAGRRVALVTGTNGKTTTAHLLAKALGTRGPVAHNHTGANMPDGALAALMARPEARLAVLEADELHVEQFAASLAPVVVVLLNLTRDQLDRSTEVSAVAMSIRRALRRMGSGTVVVANCDDPVVTAVAADMPRVRWVAAGAQWLGDAALCPRCGQPLAWEPDWWSCDSCGLHRPEPDWRLRGGEVHGPQGSAPLTLPLPGDYNRGNAMCALAAAAVLGVPLSQATPALAQVRSVAHRYGLVEHGHHRLTLLLAKNPAGWRETLPLAEKSAAVLLSVNLREADGRDTSWLWDVPFERLAAVPTVASGQAAADLGLRLAYAGVPHDTVADPLEALRRLPPGDVAVVANYTAFTDLSRRLHPRAA